MIPRMAFRSELGLVAQQRPGAVEHFRIGLAELEEGFRGVTLLDLTVHTWPIGTPKRRDTQPHGFVERARCLSVACSTRSIIRDSRLITFRVSESPSSITDTEPSTWLSENSSSQRPLVH